MPDEYRGMHGDTAPHPIQRSTPMPTHPRPVPSTQPLPQQIPDEDSLAQHGEPVEPPSRFANFDADDGNEEQWSGEHTSPSEVPKFLQPTPGVVPGQHSGFWSPTPYTSSNPIPYPNGAIPVSNLQDHQASSINDVPTEAMQQPALPPVSETSADGATIFSPVIKQFLAALVEHHEAYLAAAQETMAAALETHSAAAMSVVYHTNQIESLKQQIANA